MGETVKEKRGTNDRQVTSIEGESFEINLVAGGNFGGYNHSTPSSPSDPNHPSVRRIHPPVWRQNRRQNRTRNHEGRDPLEDFVASLTALSQQRSTDSGRFSCYRIGITCIKWRRIIAMLGCALILQLALMLLHLRRAMSILRLGKSASWDECLSSLIDLKDFISNKALPR